jgi:CubicO group peptidase (beta-lactamase class C family)
MTTLIRIISRALLVTPRFGVVGLLATVALQAEPKAVPADPVQAMISAVRPFMDGNTLAGAVMLVASKDQVLALEAVGWSDIAACKPMQTDALFWIASQTKSITAVALMMLVEEGKVHLDDSVDQYLPEFKGQMLEVERDAEHVLLRKPAHPITVREILSHTSGLPFSSPMEKPTLNGLPLRDTVRSYALVPLQFPPGTKYQYSNAGLNTAGRIVEVVSGIPYEKFLDDRLFKPLGMKETTFWPSDELIQRMAKTYKPNQDRTGFEDKGLAKLENRGADRATRYAWPAGGLFSTARDMALFCQMILNGGVGQGRRLLSEDSVRQLTTRQTPPDSKDSYGLGFAVNSDGVGHSGALGTSMQIDRKRGLVLLWMVQLENFGEGSRGRLIDAFMQATAAAFAPETPIPATAASAQP